MNSAAKETLLEVKNLQKYFPGKKGMLGPPKTWVRAVDGVSFSLYSNETLGLVGESGCGKTTTGKLILRLLEATGGEVWFENRNILKLNKKEIRRLRQKMQLIFQDPYSSLNPRMKVGDIIGEPLAVHQLAEGEKKRKRIKELLEMVGLSTSDAGRYPHEFSGGQRQRIGIARALSLNPRLIVADEPVSALDISIQAQILNLLSDLGKKFSIVYLFISHDLNVVRYMSDRVGVMYLGKIVELATCEKIYQNPSHPYTKELFSAIPFLEPRSSGKKIHLGETIPQLFYQFPGCSYLPRCRRAKTECRERVPELKDIGGKHLVACHCV